MIRRPPAHRSPGGRSTHLGRLPRHRDALPPTATPEGALALCVRRAPGRPSRTELGRSAAPAPRLTPAGRCQPRSRRRDSQCRIAPPGPTPPDRSAVAGLRRNAPLMPRSARPPCPGLLPTPTSPGLACSAATSRRGQCRQTVLLRLPPLDRAAGSGSSERACSRPRHRIRAPAAFRRTVSPRARPPSPHGRRAIGPGNRNLALPNSTARLQARSTRESISPRPANPMPSS
ncbi:hypothetical protein A4R44_00484 [Amycolatopsis sp. M39]|nr:hypothetical protein A4R44_00484 [Amycolatopsis sp. M39]